MVPRLKAVDAAVGAILGVWMCVISLVSSSTTFAEENAGAQGERISQIVELTDMDNLPIVGAKVQLRSVELQNDDILETIGEQELESDAKGRLFLPYPKSGRLGDEESPAAWIYFRIEHPLFPPKQVRLDVRTKVAWIRLEKGASLLLSAVDDNKDLVRQFYLKNGDSWLRYQQQPDEEHVSTAFQAGVHKTVLVKPDADGKHLFSGVLRVKAAEGKVIRLKNVPMRKGIGVHGSLSRNVPRPVRDGYAIVCSSSRVRPGTGEKPISWLTSVPITANGTFDVESTPNLGEVSVLAICDGWISKPTVEEQVVTPQFLAMNVQVNRQMDVDVEMVPTLSVQIDLVDPDGKPLEMGRVFAQSLQQVSKQHVAFRTPQNTVDELSSPKFGARSALHKFLREAKISEETADELRRGVLVTNGNATLRNVPGWCNTFVRLGHPKYIMPHKFHRGLRLGAEAKDGQPLKVQVVPMPGAPDVLKQPR